MHQAAAPSVPAPLGRPREQGFTLIELMVAMVIIAVLVAIAIPTFLGARDKALDRAAQSSLRNALTAAKTIYADHEDYTNADVAALARVEPSLAFVTTASTQPTQIYVSTPSTDTIVMSSYSKSGSCMWISDTAPVLATRYAETSGSCTTTEPTVWATSW